ncbi:MAG: HU family DNA-binding protein [Candidatus Accumulibacter sp.]|nr:HU family DNA-binding protein [Accumulibacter sp.]
MGKKIKTLEFSREVAKRAEVDACLVLRIMFGSIHVATNAIMKGNSVVIKELGTISCRRYPRRHMKDLSGRPVVIGKPPRIKFKPSKMWCEEVLFLERAQ